MREGVAVSFEPVDLPDEETEPRRQELRNVSFYKRGSGLVDGDGGKQGRRSPAQSAPAGAFTLVP